MAGMDWFRWHHGSVTDPKFQLIARKAGASLPDVLAVWAYMLETASQAADRGEFGEIDAEALDCLFGFPSEESRTAKILAAMGDRRLTDDRRIAAWDRRQSRREREDDGAAARKRAQRERDTPPEVTPSHATESHVTPCHTMSHQTKTEKLPACPVDDIVKLYREVLPELPDVRLMPAKRKKAIAKTWAWILTSAKASGERRAVTAEQALDWLRNYFGRARSNDFLMGRTLRTGEHAQWQCDLDFLLTDKGMSQVIEKTREAEAA